MKAMMRFFPFLLNRSNAAKPAEKAKPADTVPDYFRLAASWADDFYTATVTSRNRWRALALYGLLPLSAVLLLCVTFLVPAQHLVPLLVNHYDNGMVTVTPFKQPYAPSDQAQVESDIARYVRFRQSYSADLYDYSYRLIHLMSAPKVAERYDASQSARNPSSPINTLGNQGYQTVKVENILFLDNAAKNQANDRNHHNLAQVDFVVTTHNPKTGDTHTRPMTALLSWTYRGTPDNPGDRWLNWNGFTVTRYHVQARNG